MDEWLERSFGVKIAERSSLVPKGTAYVIDPNALRFGAPGAPEPIEIYVRDGEDRQAVMRRLARVDGIRKPGE